MGWEGWECKGDGDDSEFRSHDLQSRRNHDVCQDRRLRLTSSWTESFYKTPELKEYIPPVGVDPTLAI